VAHVHRVVRAAGHQARVVAGADVGDVAHARDVAEVPLGGRHRRASGVEDATKSADFSRGERSWNGGVAPLFWDGANAIARRFSFFELSSFLNSSSRVHLPLHCLLVPLGSLLFPLFETVFSTDCALLIIVVRLLCSSAVPPRPHRRAQRRRRNTLGTDGVAPRGRARDARVLATRR
jgi:hypothetical protein